MLLITLALTSTSSLHAAGAQLANSTDQPEIRIERRVVIERDEPTPGLMHLLRNIGGTIEVNVEVESDGGGKGDIDTLLSHIGEASGEIRIVVIGPDGHRQVIERELDGIDALIEHIDIEALLESLDLGASIEPRPHLEHGDGGAMWIQADGRDGAWVVVMDTDSDMVPEGGHRMHMEMIQRALGDDRMQQHRDDARHRGDQGRNARRGHDASMGDNAQRRHEVGQARARRARDVQDAMVERMHRVQREMEERVRRTRDGMRDRAEQRHADQGHDADRRDHPHEGHSDRRGNQPLDPHGDMDMALMRQQLMARDGHDMDPEIREHVMEMMRQGFHMPEGMNPLDAHRRNDGHGEGHGDMDMRHMHRQMMAEQDERDDDPERFFRASESFIEQLEHARAVALQLDSNAAVALLAIWYASEHMEPEQCLDLMVSVMNDESILPTVRRAAAFTGVQKAGELGNDQLAQRILGAIIRGAGMTDIARHRRNSAQASDRASDRVTDRAPRRRGDDAPRQQERDGR